MPFDADAEFERIHQQTQANIERVGEYLVAQVRQAAPVRTGKLAKSIDYVRLDTKLLVRVNEFYSAFKEFGSQHEGARPFLRPTVDNALPTVLDMLSEGL